MTGGRMQATAALAAGAYALHQVRYLLGHGDAAPEALAAHGHGYLDFLAPGVALLGALAGGQFLAAIASARRSGHRSARAAGFTRLWPAATVALLLVYAGQEVLEGLLAAGHPGGLAAVLADGGWWALPLAAGIGLGAALLVRGADAALALAARRGRRRPGGTPAGSSTPLAVVDRPRLAVIGLNLAGRAPPLSSR